jgi:PiT family inorganic phosphate transporter
MLTLIILIVMLALAFDFLNGMNDAANSIATVVSTRVLSPRLAVLWAAFFNFIAAFCFGVHVATTIGKGIVDPGVVDAVLILATLSAAIFWTYLCTASGCRSVFLMPWSAVWWDRAWPRPASMRWSGTD